MSIKASKESSNKKRDRPFHLFFKKIGKINNFCANWLLNKKLDICFDTSKVSAVYSQKYSFTIFLLVIKKHKLHKTVNQVAVEKVVTVKRYLQGFYKIS